jgi:hypothetical protein
MISVDDEACSSHHEPYIFSVSSLNAQAVAHMCDGSFNEALELLSVALDQVKLSRSRQVVWNPWLPPSSFQLDNKTVLSVGVRVSECEGSSDAVLALSMYKRAFIVSINDLELLSNQQAARISEVIILFNIGLCFHAMSLVLGAESGYSLVSAAKSAYAEALALLSPDIASTSQDGLLRLALCNNVGHICAFMCQFREAESLLQMLKQFLVCFQANDTGKGPIDDTLYDFYYNAIAVYGTHHVAPAA